MTNMMPNLPSILQQPNGNSICMLRALKQIRDYRHKTWQEEDRLNASLDDVETMIKSIK